MHWRQRGWPTFHLLGTCGRSDHAILMHRILFAEESGVHDFLLQAEKPQQNICGIFFKLFPRHAFRLLCNELFTYTKINRFAEDFTRKRRPMNLIANSILRTHMNNLDSFNLIVAQVFSSCYVAFPMNVDFSLNNISFDAPAETKPRLFACTMRWLERYGWISIELKSPAPMFLQVQLTEKALCALSWMPEALKENDRPLGQRIMEALASNAPASAVGALVGEAVKAFVRPGA